MKKVDWGQINFASSRACYFLAGGSLIASLYDSVLAYKVFTLLIIFGIIQLFSIYGLEYEKRKEEKKECVKNVPKSAEL